LGFSAANENIQSVIDNLNALGASGAIALNSPLAIAIDSLVGLSNAAINAALDQLHPALFSGYYDLQAQVGSQILTFFHRRPAPSCCGCCCGPDRAWAEVYGNWIDQKNTGIQLGFNAYSKGITAGIDREFTDGLVGGIGGAWNHTELRWHGERGHSNVDGFYGGCYLDYTGDCVYIGTSFLAGRDLFNTFRKITFSTVNEDARGDYDGLDCMAQLATAYFLGPDKCCLLPYFNLDVFYLKQQAFTEKDAPGLNLHVEKNRGMTMRSELGVGLQVIDRNRDETICVSPQLSMGWSCIFPLFRQDYTANFDGYLIPFKVVGWDHTWHLFTTRFGLTLTYTCYSLSGEYQFEIAPEHGSPLFDQRCNLRLDFNW
jgi:outer membrane autotransporter protein